MFVNTWSAIITRPVQFSFVGWPTRTAQCSIVAQVKSLVADEACKQRHPRRWHWESRFAHHAFQAHPMFWRCLPLSIKRADKVSFTLSKARKWSAKVSISRTKGSQRCDFRPRCASNPRSSKGRNIRNERSESGGQSIQAKGDRTKQVQTDAKTCAESTQVSYSSCFKSEASPSSPSKSSQSKCSGPC